MKRILTLVLIMALAVASLGVMTSCSMTKSDVDYVKDNGKLVVGVTVDELVTYKGKHAMIPFEDRIEIVRNIKYVDAAIPQYNMDKLTICKKRCS